MDLRNKWFVKQLSTQQFSGGHFTAEKRGHFAVEWWGHLRAELVGHYPRILQQSLQLVYMLSRRNYTSGYLIMEMASLKQ